LPQFCGDVDVEVADVEVLKQLVTSASREAGGEQAFADALAEGSGDAVETAAHGGLVDVKLVREIGEGALVKVVRREEKALFGGKFVKTHGDGSGEARIRLGIGGGVAGGEAGSCFELLVEADSLC